MSLTTHTQKQESMYLSMPAHHSIKNVL